MSGSIPMKDQLKNSSVHVGPVPNLWLRQVNPATVLEVLRGERPRSIPSRVRSVLLLLVSHGHAHPAGPGTSHHEWYMHLTLVAFQELSCSFPGMKWNCNSILAYVEPDPLSTC